jgi:uncharacterized protein (TIGR03435 family)
MSNTPRTQCRESNIMRQDEFDHLQARPEYRDVAGSIQSLATISFLLVTVSLCAQSQRPVEFDVVSIKRNTSVGQNAGIRTLPDGTFMMTNQPIRSIILTASPVPSREVAGIPGWVNTERYDIIAKPPAGAPREEISQMWQALFADRMKLVAHVEEQERTTFALVLARSDGRLGPQLKPSTLDCGPRPADSSPQPPSPPASFTDFANRCGMAGNGSSITSGGMTMNQFARSLSGRAGGLVNDATGLQGFYALTLTFAQPRASADTPPADNAPDFFTALQEQLGLKLKPEKMKVPIFMVDHIERPSED